MLSVARLLFVLAGIQGTLAVALGAFGAHWVRGRLAEAADGARRLEWWETAAQYHLVHALALGVLAALATRASGGWIIASAVGFGAGALVFAGTLYAMALGAPRWLGAITPLGGLLLILGWAALAVAAWKSV